MSLSYSDFIDALLISPLGTKFAILIHVLNMIADRARIHNRFTHDFCVLYIFQKFRSRANHLFLGEATERWSEFLLYRDIIVHTQPEQQRRFVNVYK